MVSPHGLALTARHVVRPWEYDRELLVLLSLDLARVDLSTVRWTVWVGGSVVLRDGLTAGYASDAADAAVRLLHAPTPLRSAEVVDSPLGPVPIERPAPGPSDVAVLQLVDFERRFEHLAIGDQPVPIETLDEVIVIGFPFMRLSDGTVLETNEHYSSRDTGFRCAWDPRHRGG